MFDCRAIFYLRSPLPVLSIAGALMLPLGGSAQAQFFDGFWNPTAYSSPAASHHSYQTSAHRIATRAGESHLHRKVPHKISYASRRHLVRKWKLATHEPGATAQPSNTEHVVDAPKPLPIANPEQASAFTNRAAPSAPTATSAPTKTDGPGYANGVPINPLD
jgi:hypothetical protein